MNDIAKPEDVEESGIWEIAIQQYKEIENGEKSLWDVKREYAMCLVRIKEKYPKTNDFYAALLVHKINHEKNDRAAYLVVGKMSNTEFQKALKQHPNATTPRALIGQYKKLTSRAREVKNESSTSSKTTTTKPDEVDELNEFIKAIPPKTIDKRKLKALIKKHVSQAENKLLDNLDAQKQHVVKLQKESEDMRQTYSDLINENALYSSREFKAMISPNHPDNGGSAKVFALLMRIKRFVGK